MEPFRTKLEQVTFSPSDQSHRDTSELDSFSNVVAYDHELVDESEPSVQLASPQTSFQGSTVLPRSPPSLPVSPQSLPTSNTSSQWSYSSRSRDGEDGIVNIGYQVYFQSPLVQLVKPAHPSLVCSSNHPRLDDPSQPVELATEATDSQSDSEPEVEPPEVELPEAELPEVAEHPGVHVHGDDARVQTILAQLRKAKRKPESFLISPLGGHDDSAGITETSQAIELQRSVIGSRTDLVAPASDEEVTRAIAEARDKLGLPLQSQENLFLSTATPGGENQELTSTHIPAMESYTGLPVKQGHQRAPPGHQSPPRLLESPLGYSAPPIGHSTNNTRLNGPAYSGALSPPLTPTSPISLTMPRTPVATVPATGGLVPNDVTPMTPSNPMTSGFHSGLHQVNATSAATSRSQLILIPHSDMTVTKEGGRTGGKTYTVPNEDLKQKLKARARSHAVKGHVKKGKRAPSEQGSETGRSTPSEYGDQDVKTMTIDSLDYSPRQQSPPLLDDSELTGSGKVAYLDNSDLMNQPRPMSSSTPTGTPGKMPQIQDMSRHDPGDVARLLREKAHLQGQVEMLKTEARTAVKDRSDLQAQLGAFKSQFKSSSGSASAFRDRDNLLTDLQHLKSERDRLVDKENRLQKLLEEKTQESSVTRVELDSAKKLNQKLQFRLDSNKQDFSGKSGELDELKNRLTSVGQELQSLRQEKRSNENQLRSAQNEIQAMAKTKDWYQEQLKTAQETRSSLQKDVSKMQIHAMEQSSAIERLKSENTHIKHQMNESQQRVLQEKENLVKHLEKIEADMLEREAAVQQLQSDKATNEGSLYERIKKVEEEKHQMAALVMTTNDLQNEVAKLRNEMSQKDEHISLLEKDHAQMIKQVTMKQETATERQKELESLESRFVELERSMKELSGHSSSKDSEILELKDQKAALEVALSSANEEKRTIDSALEQLRSDMGTVENSFRMMKTEMGRKNHSLKELKDRNNSLELELNRSKEEAETQQKSFNDMNQDISGKFASDLTLAREKLNSETSVLSSEVSTLRAALEQANSDKHLMQEHITDSEKRIHDLSDKLSNAITEKMQLQNSVHLANSEEVREVQDENTKLRGELTELQVSYNKALEKKEKELERMEKELWLNQEKMDDLKARHSEEMHVVGDRLKEAGEEQHKVERQMAELRKELSDGAEVGEQRNYLEQEIESLRSQITRLEADRDRVQTDLATLSNIAQTDAEKQERTIEHLHRQLSEANETLEEYKITKDESLKLALELEREKGRLSGVMQSHAALKQHTTDLEELLAEKESSLVDITVRTQQKLNEMSCHSSATNQRIQELEERIRQDQEVIDQLKQQLSSEKLTSTKLCNQKEGLTLELDQYGRDVEELRTQVLQYQEQVTSSHQVETGLREEVGRLREEYDGVHTELSSLRRQLEQSQERDPVVEDAIKTLQWEVDQKSAELAAWREGSKLAEQRQEVEMDAVRRTLKSTKDELDKLRTELSQTRKERFNYQAKLSELRGTVKACLRGGVDDDGVSGDQEVALVNGSTENEHQSALLIIDKILDEATTPDYDSKPLAALHQCMTSLRNQMSGLQNEIDQHALAVINTSQSWKQVETQVKELRDLCGSDECSVRSDPDSATSSQTAEDLVEKLLANGKSKLNQSQTVTSSSS